MSGLIPPPPTDKDRSTVLAMRLPEGDKERLQRAADRYEMKLSSLAHYLVMVALDLMEPEEDK